MDFVLSWISLEVLTYMKSEYIFLYFSATVYLWEF